MSNTCLLLHIVISTYRREMTLASEHSSELYRYITGILRNKDCALVAINGIPDHIHMLIYLNPKEALSSLMRDLKRSTALWIKDSGRFPLFVRWAEGYYASSVSYGHKQSVVDYIISQQEHHKGKRFDEEYERLIMKNGMTQYRLSDNQDAETAPQASLQYRIG